MISKKLAIATVALLSAGLLSGCTAAGKDAKCILKVLERRLFETQTIMWARAGEKEIDFTDRRSRYGKVRLRPCQEIQSGYAYRFGDI